MLCCTFSSPFRTTYFLSCQECLLMMAHRYLHPWLILPLQPSIQIPYPHCLPGTALSWRIHLSLPKGAPLSKSHAMTGHMWGHKDWTPCLNSKHLRRALPTPGLPIGLAEASVPFFSLSNLASLTLLKVLFLRAIIINCKSNHPPGRNSKDNGQEHG